MRSGVFLVVLRLPLSSQHNPLRCFASTLSNQHSDAALRTFAEAAVADQAEAVRELKEGQGLTNKDESVVAAVDELLRRKQRVAALQEALEQLVT